MEHLYRKLKEYANTGYYPFHMPGHKRNTALIGSELPYELDITESTDLTIFIIRRGY